MKYIMDTNTIYELLAIKGCNLKEISTGGNIKIKYNELEKFLERNLKQKKLYIAPVSFFEITSKCRHDATLLSNVFKKLEEIKNEYGYDLLCENLGNDTFSLCKTKINDIRKDYYNTVKYKDDILSKKIDSEVEVLSIFTFQIVLCFMLTKHYGYNAFFNTYEVYIKTFNDKNYDIINNLLKDKISKKLKEDFNQNKEKKSFRKMFEDVITELSIYVLYPFDYIYDSLSQEKEPTYNLSSIMSNVNNDIIENYKKWYVSNSVNKTSLNAIIENIRKIFKEKNYSNTQFEYVKNLVLDFFENKTKIDTNDAIDFWLLGYIRDDFKLVTFDCQMIQSISTGDIRNKSLINSFIEKN